MDDSRHRHIHKAPPSDSAEHGVTRRAADAAAQLRTRPALGTRNNPHVLRSGGRRMSGVGRPVLALGTHGKISTRELADGRFRATGTWRDMRGSRKPITATGATATEADSLLQQKFNKLGQAHTVTASGITSESTIETLAHVYLHSLDSRKKNKLAIQSLSRYRSTTKNTILPRLGSLRLVDLDQ